MLGAIREPLSCDFGGEAPQPLAVVNIIYGWRLVSMEFSGGEEVSKRYGGRLSGFAGASQGMDSYG
jgi:hypothetical protein